MKKTMVVLFVLVVLLAFFDSTRVSAQQSAEGRTYKIGETGPAGGIVFYDRGFTEDGWRYLEAAPAGKEFTAEWGSSVSGTETVIGRGGRNTQLIIGASTRVNGNAARLCAALEINGYKNWFLPSRDELDLMYKNLKQTGLGSFKDDWYWSSSQFDNSSIFAWAQRFGDSSQYSILNKNDPHFVRAVRAF